MGFIKLEQQSHVGIMTINRPEALNALNTEVLEDLRKALDEVEANEDIYVVVLTGEGRSFVAGADIAQMKDFGAVDGKAFGDAGNAAFLRIENLVKPVIAAVNGFALGGGCELAMACDIRIAADKAKFGQPESTLGIPPGFGGTQRLARLVGKGRAKELLFTADMIDAAEAYRIGLVNKVVAPEQLMDAAKAMVQKILSRSPLGVQACKTCVNEGLDTDLETGVAYEAEAFGLCFATTDQKEGMAAFLEKRKPNFTGK